MSYTYSHLEDYITNTYQQLQILEPSQLNLYFIADQLNLGLYPVNDPSQALRFDGRDYIFLNSSFSASERWEVFGHELGHTLWHAGNQTKMLPPFIEYQEWQADLFALHFCIPTFMLQQIKLPKDGNMAIYETCETFGVTYEFAEKRIEKWQQKIEGQFLYSNLKGAF